MSAKSAAISLWELVRTNVLAQLVVGAFSLAALGFWGTVGGATWYLDKRFDPLIDGQTKMMERIDVIERTDRAQQSIIENHEQRMRTGREDRLGFQEDTKVKLEKVDGKLDALRDQLGDVNATLAALESLITNRLPVRRDRAALGAPAWRQR